jgi:hypothetical protein
MLLDVGRWIAEIDRRHAELEMVLSTLPNTPQRLDRGELEAELTELWRYRAQIAQQLAPSRTA